MSITLDDIEYVTLYTGNNGTGACTCKCPCCSQANRNTKYQGTLGQANVMFERLPNLKQLYLLGNPDVSVDPGFCNQVITEAVKRNIHVCISTSGIGGKKVLCELLNNIPHNLVDYISFSFDATTQQEMSLLKGINYPMERAIEGLNWALSNGYTVKIQPTLWSCNYKNTSHIINFFYDRGVKWFTFHIGSLEAGISIPSHQHLTPEQIKIVHKQISDTVSVHSDIKVRCPVIYREFIENDSGKWYCMHTEGIKELLVLFTENAIKATHAPIASTYREDLLFNLESNTKINLPVLPTNKFCPFSENLSNRPDNCCRFITKNWNY